MTGGELDGFEVFHPGAWHRGSVMKMSVGESRVRLSLGTIKHLGYPEYINAFFDYRKKRLMLTASEEDFDNAIKMSRAGVEYPNVISWQPFRNEIEKVNGTKPPYYIIGKKAKSQQSAVIFELTKVERKK